MYFHTLRCGDTVIYTSSKEDVSPFDTEKNTYYTVDEEQYTVVSDDIEAYLKQKGLKLADFTVNVQPETKVVPITETKVIQEADNNKPITDISQASETDDSNPYSFRSVSPSSR